MTRRGGASGGGAAVATGCHRGGNDAEYEYEYLMAAENCRGKQDDNDDLGTSSGAKLTVPAVERTCGEEQVEVAALETYTAPAQWSKHSHNESPMAQRISSLVTSLIAEHCVDLASSHANSAHFARLVALRFLQFCMFYFCLFLTMMLVNSVFF